MANSNDLSRSIKIYIDGTPAAQGIAPVEAAIQKLEAKLASLKKSEAGYEEKSKQLKEELESKNRTLQNYQKKVQETDRILKNLSGATYKELIAVHKQVKEQLQSSIPGTQKYNAAMEQNRHVTEAMTKAQREMRVEVGCQGSTFGKATNLINKYAGLFTTTVASITGLSFAMRKSVNDYAQISEAMSNVKKYTGMTDEEVKDLNEDLKKMDTRTSREALNSLASDAGRLGIQGKKDILEFIDAADKINVALGEDLGEDAVKNIGKLAQMFGEDKRLGLREAMLATGSAVNEVAQNCSAAEPFLVEFTARVAGVAHQAGISQANIIGFAASMDENMLRNETSATAYQKILMKMFTDTEKFAKVAGLNVKEFSELVKKDANEALLTFAAAISKKGGMVDLAPLFGELKTEGAGVASVLAVMAGKTEEIRERQQLANKAYQEGTSIINEYNVQNNTVQAGLDKAKKGFMEVSYQLGERLLPLMSSMISGTSMLVRGLNTVVTFCLKYSSTLITLIAALGSYIAMQKAEIMWSKAVELWNGRILTSFKKLYTVMAAHPWMAIITVIVTFIAYLRDANSAMNESARKQKLLKDVMNEAAANAKSETNELEALIKVARDKSLSDDERRRAIEKINEISPEYLGNLTLENINTTDADIAIKKYTASILANAKAKAINAKMEELEKQKQDLKENPDLLTHWYDPFTTGTAALFSDAERTGRAIGTLFSKGTFDGWNEQTAIQQNYATSTMEAWSKRYTSEMKRISDSQQLLQDELEKTMKETISSTIQPNSISTGNGGDGRYTDEEKTEKERKARLEKLKIAYTQEQAELTQIYASGNDHRLKTEKQYSNRLLELKKDYLNKVITTAGKGTKEAVDAEKELADIQLQERKASIQKALDEEKKLYAQQQHELKEAYANGTDENLDNYETYQEALEQLEMLHLQRTLEIAGLDTEARKTIEEQLLAFKIKCLKEDQDAQKKAEKEKLKNTEESNKKQQEAYKKRIDTYKQYGEQVGSALGAVIAGQENAMEEFADTMIDIVFEVLGKIIEAEILKATATATSAVARSTAESMATTDSVLSFGASGAARAAILSGLIMGALAAAKTTLKSLIGKRSGSSSSSSGSEQSTSQRVAVSQHAAGSYDVIGKEDNKFYHKIPYIGDAPTGIVRSPALISESGAELIINADDLRRLQQHINYPLVLQAINDSRKGKQATVPQRVSGNYNTTEHIGASITSSLPGIDKETLERLIYILEILSEGIPAYVVLSELERKQRMQERSRQIGSKKNK